MSIDWSKPLKTMVGEGKVEVVRTNMPGEYPVLVAVHYPNGVWVPYKFTKDGQSATSYPLLTLDTTTTLDTRNTTQENTNMTVDWDKPLITNKGCTAVVLDRNYKLDTGGIGVVVKVTLESGVDDILICHYITGSVYGRNVFVSNAPRKAWVSLYYNYNTQRVETGSTYQSQEEALRYMRSGTGAHCYLTAVEITLPA